MDHQGSRWGSPRRQTPDGPGRDHAAEGRYARPIQRSNHTESRRTRAEQQGQQEWRAQGGPGNSGARTGRTTGHRWSRWGSPGRRAPGGRGRPYQQEERAARPVRRSSYSGPGRARGEQQEQHECCPQDGTGSGGAQTGRTASHRWTRWASPGGRPLRGPEGLHQSEERGPRPLRASHTGSRWKRTEQQEQHEWWTPEGAGNRGARMGSIVDHQGSRWGSPARQTLDGSEGAHMTAEMGARLL